MLLAQNRGLATNLHRYQSRIAELESALEDAAAARRGATDSLSVVHRALAVCEADVAVAGGAVLSAARDNAGEAGADGPAWAAGVCCAAPPP